MEQRRYRSDGKREPYSDRLVGRGPAHPKQQRAELLPLQRAAAVRVQLLEPALHVRHAHRQRGVARLPRPPGRARQPRRDQQPQQHQHHDRCDRARPKLASAPGAGHAVVDGEDLGALHAGRAALHAHQLVDCGLRQRGEAQQEDLRPRGQAARATSGDDARALPH